MIEVEGFDTTVADTYAQQATMLADLALQSYLAESTVRNVNAPGDIDTAVSKVMANKASVVNDLSSQSDIIDKNIIHALYYYIRNTDLSNVTSQVNSSTTKQAAVAEANKGLSKRQYEINEMANNGKLEILYFMQIIFVSLSFIGIIAYLFSISYITGGLFWTLVTTTVILNIIIIVFKTRYSMFSRDSRYWDKMRFVNQPKTT